MSWREKLAGIFKKTRIAPADLRPGQSGSGFMAFKHTGQVVAARKALLAAGLEPQVKAPPPELREGCDMVLEFPAEEKAVYLAVLEDKGLRPLKIASADGSLTAPESLFRYTDYPDHLMVAAANMKLTIERTSGKIVNISGGGCPDVPALAARLMNRPITGAESPEELSRSLCSFSLTQARDEAERLFRQGLSAGSPAQAPSPAAPAAPLPWPKKIPRPLSRPWLIVGTLADPAAPPAEAAFYHQDGKLIWNGRPLNPERGTAALMAAYAVCAEALGLPPGRALLAGDSGDGGGSREVYAWLLDRIKAEISPGPGPWGGLTFHYLFPLAESHDRIFLALEEFSPSPLLAADAGFMYVAKLCGQAPEYDLFTPDAGEMAYLADPLAPHPFYTRGALLQKKEPDEASFAGAYNDNNSARTMLVKGAVDNIVWRGRVIHRVAGPDVPAMEAIGGTGDTATGLATAFMAAGFSPMRAAALAAHLNRRAGGLAKPDPGSSIGLLIEALAFLLKEELSSII